MNEPPPPQERSMRACSLCGFVECKCPNRFTQQPLRVVDYTQPDRPERKDLE